MMRASKKKIQIFIIFLIFPILFSYRDNGYLAITGGGLNIDPNNANPPVNANEIEFDEVEKEFSDSNERLSQINLQSFIETIKDGQSENIRGVYSDDVLAFPVIQQPSREPGFVSDKDGVVTQFSLAKSRNVIGLLAHNYMSGKYFFDLRIGDEIQIVFGDGKIESFIVDDILNYQALQPKSPKSRFIDIESGQELSASDLFLNVYSGEYHLTLQTCIQKDNEDSWGRLFIIASPM